MIYHNRKDVYHCCYRVISILSHLNFSKIEIDKLSIIDFYLVFPIFINEIRFPQGKGKRVSKKLLDSIEPPFEYLPNKKILFSELREFQNNALQILMAKSIIELDNNFVLKGELFSNVSDRLANNNRFFEDLLFSELIRILLDIDLYGKNGIKQRTELMEFRYDPI
ncbi:hypothetical protein EOL70_24910 [Leucothrix sargassi]|nr:hypothetical protein EOL70_24910 [Leucothrix sargassi]